jgi:hypothetical protein
METRGDKKIKKDLYIETLVSKKVLGTNGSGKVQETTLVKGDVGLGNVDNTSDADKPISDDTQDALDDKIDTSEKGANNGVATLDSGGKVPVSQLPSTVLIDTFVVNSEVAMLALSAEQGDIAVRTDIETTFILQGTDPTNLGDWIELLFAQNTILGEIAFTIGNGIDIVPAGLYFDKKQLTYSGTILAWYISEVSRPLNSCNASFDVVKVSSGSTLPVSPTNSIAGTEKPTLTNQTVNKNEALTSMTTSFNALDNLALYLENNDNGRKFEIVFKTLKS